MAQRRPARYYHSAAPPGGKPFARPAKPKRRIISTAADLLIGAAVLAVIAYVLMVGSTPSVEANSEAYRPASNYRDAAAGNFENMKNRNKLTFDEKGIIDALQRQFPEISGGSVELPLVGHTPTIRLSIPRPSLFLNSQGKDYIINSQGTAVAVRADMPQVKGLPVLLDQSGFSGAAGKQILAAREVEFIQTLLAQSNRSKVPISSLTLPARAMELDVRTSDRSYYTKFHLGGDVLTQTGQFLAARQQFAKDKKHPKQYLDVRVPGKVYFK